MSFRFQVHWCLAFSVLVAPSKARVRGARYENLLAVSSKYPRIVRITWLRVSDFGFRTSGFGFRGFRASCFRFRVTDFRFWVSVLGFQVSGSTVRFGPIPAADTGSGFEIWAEGFLFRISYFVFRSFVVRFSYLRVPNFGFPVLP